MHGSSDWSAVMHVALNGVPVFAARARLAPIQNTGVGLALHTEVS